MDFPLATLKAQLDAACVGLETLGRDRSKWHDQTARETALDAVRAQLEAAYAQQVAMTNAQLAEFTTDLHRLRMTYDALVQQFTDTVNRTNQLDTQRDDLLAERNGLLAARDGLALEVQRLRRAFEALIEPFADTAVRIAQLESERDGLLAERNRVLAERNCIAAERDRLLAGRDDLVLERDGRLAERDGLVAERKGLLTERDDLAVERDGLAAERDCLAVEHAALATERDRLMVERDAFEQQRDILLGSRCWRITRPVRRAGAAARKLAEAIRPFARATRQLPRHARSARNTVRELRDALRSSRYAARHSVNWGLDQLTYAAASWRMHFGRPRTMWGVTPILTLPLLARCDRLLGLKSESLVFTTYYITSNFNINLKRICEIVYRKYPQWATRLHKVLLRLALIRYDAFHLFCDRSLLLPTHRLEINEEEMKVFRHYGRRLYTYTYGADVRTRETTLALGRYNLCAECPEPMKFCKCDEAEGNANVARIRTWATAMMAMGDMIHYVPGARNVHFWPVDTAKMRYVGTAWSKGTPLRIAHTPNHPHFKGTHYLVAAVERLQAQGHAIELVRIQGVPNSEVIALFETCDLIADQFIAGFHGYTALEGMAVGKPVLCYLRDPSMAIDPTNCPIINTCPDTIDGTLRDCLAGRWDLVELGRRSRAYVEHYYSLQAVALRLGGLYLETAGFSARVERRIRRRMATLATRVPPLIPGQLPVSWEALEGMERRQTGPMPCQI
jgi:hypothetical protein